VAEPWAPDLAEVGSRIPSKTIAQTTAGDTTPTGTFNDKTMPTDVLAQPIVNGAIATIADSVAAIGPLLYPLAKDAAAWRAAADIELAYPARNADIKALYEALNERAKLALERLRAAADVAGSGTDATVPSWSMPDPVPWGDKYL
jgi:hypothetical protein